MTAKLCGRALLILGIASAARLIGHDYGPPLGRPLPDIPVKDQDGATVNVNSLLGPNGAVLVFYRSAEWCAYCKASLADLEEHRTAFRRLGVNVAAISNTPVNALREFSERRHIGFRLLSDTASSLIRAAGLLDETVPAGDPFYGIPYPCALVLSPAGLVLAKYFEDDRRHRYTAVELLANHFHVDTSQQYEDRMDDNVSVTATASNTLVGPGQQVSLVVNLHLQPAVYLIGPTGADASSLVLLLNNSDIFSAYKIDYPSTQPIQSASGELLARGYREHVRLRGLVTLSSHENLKRLADPSGNLLITGKLHYRACGVAACSPSREIPIAWKFQYTGFERQ